MRTALVIVVLAAVGGAMQAGVSRWKQNGPLAIRGVTVLTPDPACWKRVDLEIDLTGTFQTPFDAGEIAVDAVFQLPSGKSMQVPAFFDQRFERRALAENGPVEEILRPVGAPEWKVRFMPPEPGPYRVTVTARDRSGSVTSEPVSFRARAGTGHGYIRVSRKDPHYFEFDDGTPYFAVGENLVGGFLAEYYRWIPRLAKNGGNYSRLWIGHRQFALETGPMGEYRLDNAWRLDQVMDLSEEYGIYQKMCLEAIRYITPRENPTRRFDTVFNYEDFAYSTSNGGPCTQMKDFFVLPEAKRLFKNRLRYNVARWGYSPNVLAWELWNEINAVDPRTNDPATILPWNAEMCRYLKSIDPWQHLTTNSLGSSTFWPEMWKLPENEFAQMHGYYGWHRPYDEELAKDMAGFMLKWLEPVSQFKKPFWFTEFGIIWGRPAIRDVADRDSQGVHLHNGLWAPLAFGAAGTGHVWFWDQYVDPKNLYYHFRPVAEFVKDVPWTTAGFERAVVKTSHEDLRALGLKGKDQTLLWVQNKRHTWWNAVHGIPAPLIKDGQIQVAGFRPGRYRVEYWDTYKGGIAKTVAVRTSGAELTIAMPPLDRDVALKIFRAR